MLKITLKFVTFVLWFEIFTHLSVCCEMTTKTYDKKNN